MKEIKNQAEFQAAIEQGKPVLLDFYADWCGPCRVQLPIIDKLSSKRDDVVFAKINVDHNPGLAQQFGVRSIPSLFLLQNGEIQDRMLGVQTEAVLEAKIDQFTTVS